MKCKATLRYIGLDVHKNWIQVCVLDRRGRVLLQTRLPVVPDQLIGFARSLRPTDAVALEASGFTWAVVDLLVRHAGRVVVSNPLQTRAIAHAKIKTDKVDARVLAQLLRLDYLPTVWRPDPQTRAWRHAVHFRDMFVRRRTQLKNQIHAIFQRHLLAFDGTDLFGKSGRHWIAAQRPRLHEREQFELDVLLEELDRTHERIVALSNTLAQQVYGIEDVRLLMTIPGVDIYGAVSLLAAIGDIGRFPSPKHLASYLGLTSRVLQSGDHCWTGRITKRGRSHGRWMAIQCAQQLSRAPGPLHDFYLRLKKRKGHNVAVVAVARKLVTIAWHILTKRNPYRYSLPRAAETKFARLRVLATGSKKKTGCQIGTPRSKNYGTGRRVKYAKSLNQVYGENGLPPIADLPRGELAMLRQRGLHGWADENIHKGKPIIIQATPNTQQTSKQKNHKVTNLRTGTPSHPVRPDHPSRPLQGMRGRGFASKTNTEENRTLMENRD